MKQSICRYVLQYFCTSVVFSVKVRSINYINLVASSVQIDIFSQTTKHRCLRKCDLALLSTHQNKFNGGEYIISHSTSPPRLLTIHNFTTCSSIDQLPISNHKSQINKKHNDRIQHQNSCTCARTCPRTCPSSNP